MLTQLYIELQNRAASLRNEDGATAAEYGLMVALIAAVIVGVVTALGRDIQAAFQAVVNAI